MFLRHALVDGDWDGQRHAFVRANQERVADVVALEERVRRDLLVGDDDLVAFFDARVPDDVTSARRFGTLVGEGRSATSPTGSPTEPSDLIDPAAGVPDLADFPETWPLGEARLPLTYVLDPTSDLDGVVVDVPLPLLDAVERAGLEWQVPGRRLELVTALVRTLPKDLRRRHTPARRGRRRRARRGSAPTTARCSRSLAAALTERGGPAVAPHHLDLAAVPDHLRVTYRAVDDAGRPLAWSKDLAALRRRLAERVREALATASPVAEVHGATVVDVRHDPDHRRRSPTPATRSPGTPPWSTKATRSASGCCPPSPRRGPRCGAAPAGCSCCSSVPRCARSTGRCRTPTKLALGASDRAVGGRGLPGRARRPRSTSCSWSTAVPCATRRRSTRCAAAVRAGFARAAAAARPSSWPTPLGHAAAIDATLATMLTPAHDETVLDARAHLDRLLRRGWIADAGFDQLPDVVRYLRALEHRVQKARTEPDRDRRHIAGIQRLEREYRARRRPRRHRRGPHDARGAPRQHLRPVGRRQGRRQRAQGPQGPRRAWPESQRLCSFVAHATRGYTDVVSGVGRRW